MASSKRSLRECAWQCLIAKNIYTKRFLLTTIIPILDLNFAFVLTFIIGYLFFNKKICIRKIIYLIITLTILLTLKSSFLPCVHVY